MELRCARLNCGREAAASLQFDNAGARVLIIDLTDRISGIPICRNHVKTRTPPMGWTLDDLRTVSQPSLWTDPNLGDSSPRQVPMIDRPVVDRPAGQSPARTVFDFRRSEEVSGPPPESVTTARSPLLSRAFRVD